MSSNKKKKKNAGPPKPLVQLSQCMIVKNEEKNIEQALRWAKQIAFEQIVVDTGSTDRTVEIAKRMGAKVFHFEWVNDFSAAKNFAIEQAKGNWIAFLDADEYLSDEDAKHLLYCLKQIQQDPEMRRRWEAINTPWIHVDENGTPFATQDQERIFKSFVRYEGVIHEKINANVNNIAHIAEIRIIHTGYSRGALDSTQKAERNIQMLRDMLSKNPDDDNAKVYLADSLQVTNEPEKIAEAEKLFYSVLRRSKTPRMPDGGNGSGNSGGTGTGCNDSGGAIPALRRKAYLRLITKYDKMPGHDMPREQLCREALAEFPDDIDFTYYLGETLNDNGEHREAFDMLVKCKDLLDDRDARTDSEIVAANPELIDKQLGIAKASLG